MRTDAGHHRQGSQIEFAMVMRRGRYNLYAGFSRWTVVVVCASSWSAEFPLRPVALATPGPWMENRFLNFHASLTQANSSTCYPVQDQLFPGLNRTPTRRLLLHTRRVSGQWNGRRARAR